MVLADDEHLIERPIMAGAVGVEPVGASVARRGARHQCDHGKSALVTGRQSGDLHRLAPAAAHGGAGTSRYGAGTSKQRRARRCSCGRDGQEVASARPASGGRYPRPPAACSPPRTGAAWAGNIA